MKEVPPLRTPDVVVCVRKRTGARLESPPLPAAVASSDGHQIRLRRDKKMNANRLDPPRWLKHDFDFSQVMDVSVEYRGTSNG